MDAARRADPFLHLDIAHSFAVALAACVLSLGLVYAVYLRRVWRVARDAGHHDPGGEYVLVFGKRLVAGDPDAEFEQRLRRARALATRRPARPLLLLGGGAPGSPTEAEVGRSYLERAGLPGHTPVWLEDQSQDTLENLRNARSLLQSHPRGRVVLLSNRYHLARCALLARQMGLDGQLCAAEPGFTWRQQSLPVLMREAAYVCWLDLGTRWAQLIGHRRMLRRVR